MTAPARNWLERHLRPDGLLRPHCGHSERRLFCAQGHFPAYRCLACKGYDTLLTGTVFAKTRQRLQANLNHTAPAAVMVVHGLRSRRTVPDAGETTHTASRAHGSALAARP